MKNCYVLSFQFMILRLFSILWLSQYMFGSKICWLIYFEKKFCLFYIKQIDVQSPQWGKWGMEKFTLTTFIGNISLNVIFLINSGFFFLILKKTMRKFSCRFSDSSSEKEYCIFLLLKRREKSMLFSKGKNLFYGSFLGLFNTIERFSMFSFTCWSYHCRFPPMKIPYQLRIVSGYIFAFKIFRIF